MNNQERAMRKIWARLPIIALVLLVLLVIGLGSVIKDRKQQMEEKKRSEVVAERPPVNVVTLKLVPASISDRINLPATAKANEDLLVKTQVGGEVIEADIKEGSRILKGDLIARIDKRDYEIALRGGQAAYDQARKALKRAERLYKKEIIAEEDYDSAIANEKTLKAALEQARLNLERTEITSAISGVLNRLDAKVGLIMQAGDTVAQVLEINPIKVIVGVPESDVTAVKGLSRFDVTVKALGGKHFTGRKNFLSSQPASMAHLYMLEILVQNPDGMILPGMFARVGIVKEEVAEGLSVPLYAIITQGKRRYVYVENEGIATARDVDTGFLEGWRMQIINGLSSGDNVIVVGHRSLTSGQSVSVVKSVDSMEALLK